MNKEEIDVLVEKFQAKLNLMTEDEIKNEQEIYASSSNENFECDDFEIIYPTTIKDGD